MGETLNAPTSKFVTELLSPEKIMLYWPGISGELRRIPHVWADWYTLESLLSEAMSGGSSVFASGTEEAAFFFVFTRIVDLPAARILSVFLGFGTELEDCLPSLIASLEVYANKLECDRCEVMGREGWGKFLPNFTKRSTIFTRKLERFKVQ